MKTMVKRWIGSGHFEEITRFMGMYTDDEKDKVTLHDPIQVSVTRDTGPPRRIVIEEVVE